MNSLVGEWFVERVVAALQEQLIHQKGDGVHGEGSGKGRPLLSSSTAFQKVQLQDKAEEETKQPLPPTADY